MWQTNISIVDRIIDLIITIRTCLGDFFFRFVMTFEKQFQVLLSNVLISILKGTALVRQLSIVYCRDIGHH